MDQRLRCYNVVADTVVVTAVAMVEAPPSSPQTKAQTEPNPQGYQEHGQAV